MLTSFCVSLFNNISFQASNCLQAYKEAARVVKELVDGTVLTDPSNSESVAYLALIDTHG
jgi:hypothetical protein